MSNYNGNYYNSHQPSTYNFITQNSTETIFPANNYHHVASNTIPTVYATINPHQQRHECASMFLNGNAYNYATLPKSQNIVLNSPSQVQQPQKPLAYNPHTRDRYSVVLPNYSTTTANPNLNYVQPIQHHDYNDRHSSQNACYYTLPNHSNHTSHQNGRSYQPMYSYITPSVTKAEELPSYVPLNNNCEQNLVNSLSSLQVKEKNFDSKPINCSGLKNLGNTCYMNSVLQCLVHTTDLNKYCLTKKYKDELKSKSKTPLFYHFAELVKEMSLERHHAISPANFKKKLTNSTIFFDNDMQCDAQEFLTFTLQLLGEEVLLRKKKMFTVKFTAPDDNEKLARKAWKDFLSKENNIITDLFMGQMSSKLIFQPCGHESIIFEPTLGLSVPVPICDHAVNLDQCLQLYFQQERLSGDNQITCESCNQKLDAIKHAEILKLPKILIIHLKRFKNMSNGMLQKNMTFVHFPLTQLSMSSYAYKSAHVLYDLYAIVDHFGTPSNGHYSTSLKYDQRWITMDDENVSAIPNNMPSLSNAYILFYKMSTQKLLAEDATG